MPLTINKNQTTIEQLMKIVNVVYITYGNNNMVISARNATLIVLIKPQIACAKYEG